MRRLLAVGILGALGLIACDENPSSPTYPKITEINRTPAPTPTPRPTPLTFVGRWVVANSGINQEHVLWNWTVEIQSHDTVTGEVRGLSHLRSLGGPGILRGTVRGNHLDWQTTFGNFGNTETENGSMDLTRYSNGDFLEGTVKFELPVIRYQFTFTGAALRKE